MIALRYIEQVLVSKSYIQYYQNEKLFSIDISENQILLRKLCDKLLQRIKIFEDGKWATCNFHEHSSLHSIKNVWNSVYN